MPKTSENKVFRLISTLSKAEKRHFQIFAKRNQVDSSPFFLKVFDVYDKYGMVSDSEIIQKVSGIKPVQLSNIRNNLYRQLLTSLRLQHQKTNPDIAIRQEIDFGKVLYNKGLYRQALEILNKAKSVAKSQNRNILALEILFFEKAIESQNITKSIGDRAADLINDSIGIFDRLEGILHFSNLDLELYAHYLHAGFCKREEAIELLDQKFLSGLQALEKDSDDFYTKLYFYQCYCWYAYIKQDFANYYRHAQLWVKLFEDNSEMVIQRPSFYLKGIHNAISGAFMNKDDQGYKIYFDQLRKFKDQHPRKFTWNEQGIYELYINMHEIDQHFRQGNFIDYLRKKDHLEQLIEKNPYHWDKHRIAIFRYKLACLTFGVDDYKGAIDQFNEIRKLYKHGSRSMVLRFVRILSAFAHYKLENYQLVESLILTLKKDLASTKENYQPLETALVKLLEQLTNTVPQQHDEIVKKALKEIRFLEKDPFVKIAFLHFYATEWLESLIRKTKAEDILAENYLRLRSK